MNKRLKLAIQKKGRLSEKSIQLLRNCGLDIENFRERLIISSNNFKLDLLFLRDDDIPEYVQENVAQIGIVGENVVLEKGLDVEIVKKLGFGKCTLSMGIPESSKISDVSDLNGKTIATSYPNILKNYLNQNNISAKIIELSGSVEIAPSLGVADIICDLVSSGNTLKLNKLKKSIKVLDSEAVLIKNKSFSQDVELKNLFNNLLGRIDSSLKAKKSKYIMMNIPKSALGEITNIIPALNSPTVLPLADKEMLAVHAVISESKFWEIADDLKLAGASGILSLPIENIIL